MRVVVDTSVWVSALLTPAGPPARIRKALEDYRFSLIISEPLQQEIVAVLSRPRFQGRYGLTPEEVAEFLILIEQRAEFVEITGAVRLCRDPNDDAVIETALNGHADALVSRDDDLKGATELVEILRKRGVAILTVRRFLELLEAADQPA